jgi:glycosyltransferase involved in cell wall biosynthesis
LTASTRPRRRLAFVIHDLNSWGGHDRSTLEIARRLSHRLPVDVCSFTLNDPRGLGSWGDVRLHRIRPNIAHPVMLKSTWFYGASIAPLRFLPRVKGEPRPLVHATGACSLVSDVVQVQFVNAAWKRVRATLDPSVFQSPRARTAGPVGRKALELYHQAMLDYNIAVEKSVYRPHKTYIAIADCVARELREHFGLKRDIHVIRHGVDSSLFRPAHDEVTRARRAEIRRELGAGERDVVLAFVGAYERKGLAAAVDALAKLSPAARGRAVLMAVGGGSIEGFAARARALGVHERVRFVQHTKEVQAYFRAADAFVLPTLYEPFGLVILEAMATGLAPLVSRLAGGSELIEPGRSGWLVEDPRSAGEIAGHLERLVLDAGLRTAMGARARAIAEARSWDRVADEYAALLEPMLEAAPS